jgi:hypothetical protein
MMARSFTVLALLSTLAFAGSGCSKKDSGSSAAGSSGSAGSTSTSSACADRLASTKTGATDEDKKNFATVCAAISNKAQTCIGAAKSDKDMDACLTDKTDKEAVMAAVLGAAMKQASASSGTSKAVKLDKLGGLQMDVPGESMVSDGIGPNSQMVNSVAIGGVTVSEAGSSTPKTLKAAKSDAALFKPKNLQGEQSSDGYWLTFENTGSAGTNYWVKTVKQFGKKSYACEGVPDTADKAQAALAACKSLRQ